jgi:enamine deaminase RidA (YjgF/YER057c/UK114 family)
MDAYGAGKIMANINIFNPDTINAPRAPYSQVAEVAAGAKLVMIAGQVAIDRDGRVVGPGDIEKQAAQVFANLGDALAAAGGGFGNVIQYMSFLTRKSDIPGFAAYRQREFARLYPSGAYPPNTLLIVNGLVHDDLVLEVQATAAI